VAVKENEYMAWVERYRTTEVIPDTDWPTFVVKVTVYVTDGVRDTWVSDEQNMILNSSDVATNIAAATTARADAQTNITAAIAALT
jgi:hypothetical protein